MKNLLSFFILFSFILFLSSSSINAQGKYGIVGKSFNKGEANILFGKVMGSIQVAKSDIEKAIEKAGDYVLFGIKNSRVYVLDEKKLSLEERGFSFSRDEVAYMFSTIVVKEFLERTNGKYLTFELRYNSPKVRDPKSGQYSTSAAQSGEIVFTLTGDEETLEMALPCPPMCLD
ncbi:MAG: hypothetical protein KGZ42_11550 [Melioribacter sp.]|nr:hypothetical protein [Melioribacter sp.]